MSKTPSTPPGGKGYASSPCMAEETGLYDPQAAAARHAADVARWRKAERSRLRAERLAMSVAERQAAGDALSGHLRQLLKSRSGGADGQIISFYWPIKGEPDLRPLMAELHAGGATIALPIVETKAAPLVFRLWTPETRLVRGDWNIPVPPPDAPQLTPGIVLAPLVGWANGGYRLGYGGGYFDRTLAALSPRPFAIGIGLDAAQLPTILPQPHDIPLDVVLTETGEQFANTAS
ncbi:5-formyltetrahydrofolate cyclo-ligase [Leisingera sp.]|uniref:5-formyltetrahydrofolate cyclo-ligase n=1 Tax=Leisingera sp. TaxID=1879318 RepID=UPI002B2722EC|nr:5-formyltetrahydrofolate cyclo-ligase [Leisingera sp.]